MMQSIKSHRKVVNKTRGNAGLERAREELREETLGALEKLKLEALSAAQAEVPERALARAVTTQFVGYKFCNVGCSGRMFGCFRHFVLGVVQGASENC